MKNCAFREQWGKAKTKSTKRRLRNRLLEVCDSRDAEKEEKQQAARILAKLGSHKSAIKTLQAVADKDKEMREVAERLKRFDPHKAVSMLLDIGELERAFEIALGLDPKRWETLRTAMEFAEHGRPEMSLAISEIVSQDDYDMRYNVNLAKAWLLRKLGHEREALIHDLKATQKFPGLEKALADDDEKSALEATDSFFRNDVFVMGEHLLLLNILDSRDWKEGAEKIVKRYATDFRRTEFGNATYEYFAACRVLFSCWALEDPAPLYRAYGALKSKYHDGMIIGNREYCLHGNPYIHREEVDGLLGIELRLAQFLARTGHHQAALRLAIRNRDKFSEDRTELRGEISGDPLMLTGWFRYYDHYVSTIHRFIVEEHIRVDDMMSVKGVPRTGLEFIPLEVFYRTDRMDLAKEQLERQPGLARRIAELREYYKERTDFPLDFLKLHEGWLPKERLLANRSRCAV